MAEIFEERTFTYTDKSGWPPGPWESEVDRIQWVDTKTGYDCLLTRNPRIGYLCGYVGLPPDHPLSGTKYGAVNISSVHLTFSDFCMVGEEENGPGVCHLPYPGRPEKVYWFGFDCSHFNDHPPRGGAGVPIENYKTIASVREMVTALASDLETLK